MSQEKVEKYKEYKKNRAKILKKEKILRRLEYSGIALVCAVFIGWFCWSIYNSTTSSSSDTTSTTAMTAATANADRMAGIRPNIVEMGTNSTTGSDE